MGLRKEDIGEAMDDISWSAEVSSPSLLSSLEFSDTKVYEP